MDLRHATTAKLVLGMCLAAAVCMSAVSSPALAQEPNIGPSVRPKKIPQAPAKLPRVTGDKTKNLDFLFGALKAAPDEESAKAVEARIWSLWTATNSDTAALLMLRAKLAMDSKDMDVALKLLDAVIKLRQTISKGEIGRAHV